MRKQKCSWKYCRTEIEVDDSFESSGIGKSLGISVGGWCKFHSRVYNIQCDLFAYGNTKKHHSDIANKISRESPDAYKLIQNLALDIAKGKLKVEPF